MAADSEPLPDDIDALRAEVAAGRARAAADQALIAHQQLQIAKLRHALYGQRSERAARLIEQMELGLEEAETAATEDEIAAEQAAARTTNVAAFVRKRPSRQPFPEHLPRERVVGPAPVKCLCCGGARLRRLGEDVTETLEGDPAPLEGDPACAGEVHLPRLRGDQPSAGAVPRDAPWLGWPQPAGDDHV